MQLAPMTEEEFKESIIQMSDDTQDVFGDFKRLRGDFEQMVSDAKDHDPQLAEDIKGVVAALDKMAGRVNTLAEGFRS